ncbi:ABC transporter substrate-binding protein [Roseibacterium sp. SDUM158016]|uniref:ABC transporter substrate-binding protein n=1 Tax=Roseicyclus sediminis TaxID=2980997 RepID=UPI0021D12CAE|nr:ABC transporter substrate-binding protein [Roseibacterium sp. SDUM158016]MCU4652113.1 ABC transporter substrate-binding protein [Roseibacterium sp. SDUM158016]
MISKYLATVAAILPMMAVSSAMAEEYTVAVLQSSTGGAAFIGAPIRDGMIMAAEEINASGVLGEGNSLNLIVGDDATDRTQTLSLMTRYANDPEVLAVLGPTSSATALSGTSVANEVGVVAITITNSLQVLENGPWSYILTQPAFVTMPYLADFTANSLDVERCAVIGINDVESYVTVENTYKDLIREAGIEIVSEDGIAATASDFSAIATRIATGNQDCVFISAPAAQGANIIIQLRQAGLDPDTAVIGHSAFASPQFIERGGAAVEGVYLFGDYVPGGFNEYSAGFDARFAERFGNPPDNWAAVGYGGMQVIAAAIREAQPNVTRETIRDAIMTIRDVPVVVGQGVWELDEERIPRIGVNILQVQDGAFVAAE